MNKTKDKLIDIYDSILRFVGMTADEKGLISTSVGNQFQPTMIDGKRAILPTKDILRNGAGDELIILHPLSEISIAGESIAISHFRKTINIRLNYAIGVIGQSLLNIFSNKTLHQTFTPEQTDGLTLVGDIDSISVRNFTALMLNGVKLNADRVFINIFIKPGGSVKNVRYRKAGIVTFPAYHLLNSEEANLFGKKIRKKDEEVYRKLFEYILPDIVDKEGYNVGTNSLIAPYLEVLLWTASGVAEHLNSIIDIYKDHIDNYELIKFDMEFTDYLRNLEDYQAIIRSVPSQTDSRKHIEKEEPVTQDNHFNEISNPMQVLSSQNQPALLQSKPTITKNGLDFNSLLQIENRNKPYFNNQQTYNRQPSPLLTQHSNNQGVGFNNGFNNQGSI